MTIHLSEVDLPDPAVATDTSEKARGKTLAFGGSGVATIGIGIWVLVDGNLLGGTALIGIGGVVVFVGGVISFVSSRSW